MKKLFIAAIAAICALGVSAQTFWDGETAEKKFTLGVRAGLNIADMSGDDVDAKSKANFHAGVSADWNIVNSFSVNSGIFYTGKGAKDFSANFIEIPIYASYRLNFAEASQLQVNFGPYLDFGVGGDAFKDYDDGGIEGKRFQMGLGVGAGYTFSKFFVGLQYQFGLTDCHEDLNAKYNNLAISVGYNF
ncbi:MAG: porin family protein [Bacteroides sp.]|nr:porin family protein [Lachnospiraceae bacterium]MCM1331081.1 porin family protein [Bacteroides sp.]MCM1331087.1 porin family protein [Bacteroides sp.]MCM1389126.1 porin family protein [Bacteroides sp.]MCM1389132.1 porin family protein [Bacteroides sp.]